MYCFIGLCFGIKNAKDLLVMMLGNQNIDTTNIGVIRLSYHS